MFRSQGSIGAGALSWQRAKAVRTSDRIAATIEANETLPPDDAGADCGSGAGGRGTGEAMTSESRNQRAANPCAFDLMAASLPHIDSDDDECEPHARLVLTSNERQALYDLANKPASKRQSIILGTLVCFFVLT